MEKESLEQFGEWLIANYPSYSFHVDATFHFFSANEFHASLFDAYGENIADIHTPELDSIIPYFRLVLEMPIEES